MPSATPLFAILAGALLGLLWFLRGPDETPVPVPAPQPLQPAPEGSEHPPSAPGSVTRRQILEAAHQMASTRWVMAGRGRNNRCAAGGWGSGEPVSGIAYKWGGCDGPTQFLAKLRKGYSAGSHSWSGVSECTAGIDCSAFVTRCWGLGEGHPYTTSTMHRLGANERMDPHCDLRPGDALLKPGAHVVLFAGYRQDGNPVVYEALGSAGRVILNRSTNWSRYRGYYPLRFRGVSD